MNIKKVKSCIVWIPTHQNRLMDILRRYKRTTRWVKNGVAGLVTFCMVIFFALVIWVSSGPKSIKYLTPYIEYALSPPTSHYTVKIENTEIAWEGFSHPLGLIARNVGVIDDNGAIISYFPEIGVSIYLHRIILGKLEIKSLEFKHPALTLVQKPDGSIALGSQIGEPETTGPSASLPLLLKTLVSNDGDSSIRNIKSIKISHASIALKHAMTGVVLESPDANFEIRRKKGNASGTISLPVLFENKSGNINANFSLEQSQNSVTAEIIYNNIQSRILKLLLPNEKMADVVTTSFTGATKINADFNGQIDRLDFAFEAGQGDINYPEQFAKPVNMNGAKFLGNITEHLSRLTVTQGKLSLIGSNSKLVDLRFSGTSVRVGNEFSLDGKIESENIAINDLPYFWAKDLSPHSRKWITEHVSNGLISKVQAEAHLKPGEIKLKDTPEKGVTAKITLQNTDINYNSHHPVIKDISGVVQFTGRSMDARITHAAYLSDSFVTSGSVKMPDMYPDDVQMLVDFEMQAKAKDVATFLDLPDINKAKILAITPDIKGEVIGNVKLDFIAFSEHEKDNKDTDVNYNVNVALRDVAQKGFLNKYDTSNADIKIALDNKALKAEGTATVNALPMHIQVESSFGKNMLTQYSVQCEMPVKRLKDFELPDMAFINGTIGVNANFSESDTVHTTSADLDITDLSVDLPVHGFYKKTAVPAKLELKTEKAGNGNTQITSFNLKGDGMHLSGNALFNKQAEAFDYVNFDTLQFGDNDLSELHYTRTPSGLKLKVRGNSFDATPYYESTDKSKSNLDMEMDIQTSRLVVGKNKQVENISLFADCGTLCRYVSMHATLAGNTSVDYSINNGVVRAHSDNAGEVLRVLGAFESMSGGQMQLNGKYNGDKIQGDLLINDYTLKNAPVLTKILTIASLSGIVDTLSGNGIYFSKMTAPYLWKNNIIVTKDAKTHGSALGVTADGILDLNKAEIDISGVIVPSYTVNSLIGNVPLIGDLLVGGSGKGIIGINYSVKGKTSAPSVGVNPLSALTPGFLRNIFNLFDKPAPDIDKISEKTKPSE